MREGQLLPHDADTEHDLLNALFVYRSDVAYILGQVQPEHFYLARCRLVYEAIQALRGDGDEITVAQWMREHGTWEAAGGISTLMAIRDRCTVSQMVDSMAGIIQEKARARSVIAAALEVVDAGYAGYGHNIDRFAADAVEWVRAAAQTAAIARSRSIADTARVVCKNLIGGKPPVRMIRTGFGRFDASNGGVRSGDLTVLAARPSMGKSAVMINMAVNMALAGERVYIATLEDSAEALNTRIIARFAEINTTKLFNHELDMEHFPRVQAATDRITTLPIRINDTKGRTVAQIRGGLMDAMAREGVTVAFVDHMHRILGPEREETARYSKIVMDCADMASDLKIPVVILAQLNRQSGRSDKRPRLEDLRQSGTIEEAARAIWLCYRGGYYNPDFRDAPELEIIVAKSSHGVTGSYSFHAQLQYMSIQEWEQDRHGSFRNIEPRQDASEQPHNRPRW